MQKFQTGTSSVGSWVRIKGYFLNKSKAQEFLELDSAKQEIICNFFATPEIIFKKNDTYELLANRGFLLKLKISDISESFYTLNPLVIEAKFPKRK